MTGLVRWCATGVVVALGVAWNGALAQAVGACGASPGVWSDAALPPPLDRPITLRLDSVPLRDALDRAAEAGRLSLSYSREFIPSDRRVCLDRSATPVGRVIEVLLAETGLEAVALGGDQVVLRRRSLSAWLDATPRPESEMTAQRMMPVVVIAEPRDRENSASGIGSRTVIDFTERETAGATSLADLLDGRVPGMWAWESGSSVFAPRYASVRGASAFGSSSVKTYIDGVEVANAQVSTLIAPDNIASIEIIRGPQGTALYGSDALNGVMNITTRHDGAGDGTVRWRAQTATGVMESDYATAPALAQSHSMSLRAGSDAQSLAIGFTHSQTGAYVPGGQSRQTTALATARRVGAISTLGMTARVAAAHVAAAPSAQLGSISPAFSDSGGGESLSQYTVGLSAQLTPDDRWTHSLVLGADGYRVFGPATTAAASGLAADGATGTPPWSADRASVRASSTVRVATEDGTVTTLTLAAEHSALRQVAEAFVVQPMTRTGHGMPPLAQGAQVQTIAQWRRNTGVSSQLDMAFANGVSITGGLRMEHVGGLVGPASLAPLPLLGIGYTRSHGDVTVRLHGAFGKGIRSPSAAIGVPIPSGQTAAIGVSDAMPEEQTGSEVGVEMSIGRSVVLRATHFYQVASRLTQPVAGPAQDGERSYSLQNVGGIVNRGWELEQQISLGPLSLGSSVSRIDSRVRDVADEYTGDLRPGDRTLAVPLMILGASLAYRTPRTSASLDLSHARDWINYDVLALQATDAAPTGAALRSYWRTYSGTTGLRATVSRSLRHGLTLVFTGDNLLDRQRGVPDNATIVPGRTTTLGLRVQF